MSLFGPGAPPEKLGQTLCWMLHQADHVIPRQSSTTWPKMADWFSHWFDWTPIKIVALRWRTSTLSLSFFYPHSLCSTCSSPSLWTTLITWPETRPFLARIIWGNSYPFGLNTIQVEGKKIHKWYRVLGSTYLNWNCTTLNDFEWLWVTLNDF